MLAVPFCKLSQVSGSKTQVKFRIFRLRSFRRKSFLEMMTAGEVPRSYEPLQHYAQHLTSYIHGIEMNRVRFHWYYFSYHHIPQTSIQDSPNCRLHLGRQLLHLQPCLWPSCSPHRIPRQTHLSSRSWARPQQELLVHSPRLWPPSFWFSCRGLWQWYM